MTENGIKLNIACFVVVLVGKCGDGMGKIWVVPYVVLLNHSIYLV